MRKPVAEILSIYSYKKVYEKLEEFDKTGIMQPRPDWLKDIEKEYPEVKSIDTMIKWVWMWVAREALKGSK